MAWETRARGGRYYTRSVRKDGRVHREYIGTGPTAELIAAVGALEHAQLRDERAAVVRQRQSVERVEAAVDDIDIMVETMTRLELVCAGFHRHHRGAWRKRRG